MEDDSGSAIPDFAARGTGGAKQLNSLVGMALSLLIGAFALGTSASCIRLEQCR